MDGRLERLERDEHVHSMSNDLVDVAVESTQLASPVKVGKSIVRQRAPRYDGTSTWEAYLAQFEITAELNGWTAPEKAAFLATSLDGSAANVLGALPADQRKEYLALITALGTRFGCSVQIELNRVRLRNRRRQRGEPLVVVADDVERLARLTYADASIDTQNIHAMEQFIEVICDDDLRVRVLQSRPMNLQEALTSALELESYTLAVRAMESVPDNNTVSDINQMMEEVVARFSASMTKQLGNMMSGNRQGISTVRSACWNCGEIGHYSHSCSKQRHGYYNRAMPPTQTNATSRYLARDMPFRSHTGQELSGQPNDMWWPHDEPERQRSGNDRQPISRGGGRSTVNDNCCAPLNETIPCCDDERSDRSGDDKTLQLPTGQADYSVFNVRTLGGRHNGLYAEGIINDQACKLLIGNGSSVSIFTTQTINERNFIISESPFKQLRTATGRNAVSMSSCGVGFVMCVLLRKEARKSDLRYNSMTWAVL